MNQRKFESLVTILSLVVVFVSVAVFFLAWIAVNEDFAWIVGVVTLGALGIAADRFVNWIRYRGK